MLNQSNLTTSDQRRRGPVLEDVVQGVPLAKRKIKCDLTKSECLKCTSTGRKCPGYPPLQVQWQDPYLPKTSKPPVAPLAAKSVSAGIDGNDEELRAFSYFLEYGQHQMAGFFTSSFWNRMVLQAAHFDSGVRHAVVALSSLYERYEARNITLQTLEKGTGEVDFSLRQYNKAITKLLEASNKKDNRSRADVNLATCVIFICIEILQGHAASAMTLVANGLKMLRDLQEKTKGDASNESRDQKYPAISCVPLEAYDDLFRSLNIPTTEALTESNAFPRHRSELTQPDFTKPFSSLAEAREALDFSWYVWVLPRRVNVWCTLSVSGGIDPIHAPRYQFLHAQWCRSFEGFLAQHEHELTSRKDQRALMLLQAHRRVVTIILALQSPQCNSAPQFWDRYNDIFGEIIDLCEKVVEMDFPKQPSSINPSSSTSSSTPPAPQTSKRSFSLDVGILAPICCVVYKCRHPTLRRRGLNLMRTVNRVEGIWDCRLAANLLGHLVDMEEKGLAWEVKESRDVPDWRRYNLKNVTMEDGGWSRWEWERKGNAGEGEEEVVRGVEMWKVA
ncbi:MAG: hypothetical protein Q9227_008900 [Pyrenula ochraceoflavens]